MVSKQKSLPKKEASESDNSKKGSIVPTDSWINVKGKAVYVNIPEKDVILVSTEYGKRLSFITSLDSLKKMVDGTTQGTKLGRFE